MMLKESFIVLFAFILTINNSLARENCQSKYDSNKRSLPSLRGNCKVCHINPNGGGTQNEFGRAFKANDKKITSELIAQFPDLFKEPPSTPLPDAEPFVRKIKPQSVKIDLQSMIMILGRDFVEGSKAFIDNSEVLTTFRSHVQLVVDFVLNTVGTHELKVKNPNGKESNTVLIRAKEPAR